MLFSLSIPSFLSISLLPDLRMAATVLCCEWLVAQLWVQGGSLSLPFRQRVLSLSLWPKLSLSLTLVSSFMGATTVCCIGGLEVLVLGIRCLW